MFFVNMVCLTVASLPVSDALRPTAAPVDHGHDLACDNAFDYVCPVYYPNISDTSLKALQVIQNGALRTVTGCHMKTPIVHLHTECKELKVKDHLDLLSTQFLASAMRPSHTSHSVVTAPAGPCRMKETSLKVH
jgi:hypothetical protein